MKRFIFCAFCVFCVTLTTSAQKFALIDMEYILKNIPAYDDSAYEIKILFVADALINKRILNEFTLVRVGIFVSYGYRAKLT